MPHSKLIKPIPVGARFGRWTVIGDPVQVTAIKRGRPQNSLRLPCRCECGTESNVNPGALRIGSTRSCGCLQREAASVSPSNKTHGLSGHPLHSVWCAMRSRCTNPSDQAYRNYGGRGIIICKEWREFTGFYSWAITHWKPRLSMDRIDNDKGYFPDNCRFVSQRENLNNRRNTIWVTFNGERMSLGCFAGRLKLPYPVVRGRYMFRGSADATAASFRENPYKPQSAISRTQAS